VSASDHEESSSPFDDQTAAVTFDDQTGADASDDQTVKVAERVHSGASADVQDREPDGPDADPADYGHPDCGHPDTTPPDTGEPAVVRPGSPVTAKLAAVHPTLWLTYAAAGIFTLVFGRLAVRHHSSYGTWSFDMGIYDQAFWLASRFGKTFLTVRGLEFWGHHINLVAYLYAPFYWFGAGPSFLYVSQAAILALGAVPTYLIARDRFRSPWAGLVFAVAYLMYPAVQWISWANFHPEALVITPLLFAWWLAGRNYWRAFIVAILLALSTREDTALVVVVMGVVLTAMHWKTRKEDERSFTFALSTGALGALWYLVATKLVIPHYNDGQEPFYITYFYGDFGKTSVEVALNMLRHPDHVLSLAVQPDRARFYRDLLLPLGGLPLLGLPFLSMAGPQLLASVTGRSPYARQIMYQYTSVMIAPIFIAAIEGTSRLLRTKARRYTALAWLLACTYVSNTAWSPSPLSAKVSVWAKPNDRTKLLDAAVASVPKNVRLAATYSLLPHLSGRRYVYDWPNPWVPAYWGNDLPDGSHLPAPHDPNTVEWIAIDMYHVGPEQLPLIQRLIGPNGEGGEFQVVFRSHIKRPDPSGVPDPTDPTGRKQIEDIRDQVIVARRVHDGPASTAR
jgi:uncharacterized membrane protein